jgi:hypothetical protein
MLALAVAAGCVAGCGDDTEKMAHFKSQVIQMDRCERKDDGPETCVVQETVRQLQLTLVEDPEARAWLHGVVRDGQSNRTILGTRDSQGGYLFYAESTQDNAKSECRLTQKHLLSVAAEEGVDPFAEEADPCQALVGREVRTTVSSAECSETGEKVERIQRARWEAVPGCSAP